MEIIKASTKKLLLALLIVALLIPPTSGIPTVHAADANVAPLGIIDVPHSNGGVSTNINSASNPATGSSPSGTWNTWGSNIGGSDTNPFYVTLTLPDVYDLGSMRVMWWIYTDSGVNWPTSCTVEYMDMATKQWVSIGNVGLAHRGEVGQTWVYNDVWNDVTFSPRVKTQYIRLRVRKQGTGTSPGFGINRWQVFGELPETADLFSVSATGTGTLPVGLENDYSALPISPRVTGVNYQWTLDNDNAAIVGSSTGSTVKLIGVKKGPARLTVTASHPSSPSPVSGFIDFNVTQMEALPFETGTAAGRAPILPKRVVVDGLMFDTPTASATGSTGYNFAEAFEQSLIPVTWDMSSFTAADYAADKIGTSFEVTGVTTAGSRAPGLPAKAIITVNEPVAEIDYNHSITSENVIFDDIFWAPKQLVNATTTLDAAATQLAGSASYAERNFVNALGRLQSVWNGNLNPPRGTYSGYVFQDTDIYKTLEGYAYNLAAIWEDTSVTTTRKNQLLDKAKYWISLIEAIQYADGYLNSCFSNRSTTSSGGSGTGDWRWRYMDRHEMYNTGHFLEAAVAYTRFTVGTGQYDYTLYEVGKRAADHIVNMFGPGGKRVEVPGHEEVELALMKFATLCEEFEGVGAGQKYRDTTELLVDRRGRRTGENTRQSGYSGGSYSQDATALVNETRAVGHAVRAMYFYTGATDIAIALPDSNPNKAAFLRGITSIYETASERNTYITGGLGSGESSEGFGADYHIRNTSAYTENCAAIAGANWYQRLNLYYEDAKYADSYERALYNGVLVGVNLDGNRFYYGCGLDGAGQTRGTWQGCACCPPNVIRTIANIGGYVYTVNKDNVFVNMFGGSTGHVNVQGDDVVIRQETDYPWDGAIKMTVTPPTDKVFTLNLRVPGWVKAQKYQQVTLLIDGKYVDATPNANGYIPIKKNWSATGVVINYVIPMEVRFTEADYNVTAAYPNNADYGQNNKVVIERGPIVYHLEQPGVPNGNPATATTGRDARQVYIPRDIDYALTWKPNLLRGVYDITGYARFSTATGDRNQYIQLTPYYTKENRGNNPQNTGMTSVTGTSSFRVWINATEMGVLIRGDKNKIDLGATAKLTANPKVNYSDRNTPASYEWAVISGSDVIELIGSPAAGRTDDSGYGKIGGVNNTLATSIATYKAVGYGAAQVQVTMKNAAGATLATDTYDIEVSDLLNISVDNRLIITPLPLERNSTNPKFSVYATGNTPISADLIVVAYDANGRLADNIIQAFTLNGPSMVKEMVVQAPSIPYVEGYTYKFFIWDSSFVPMTAITSIDELN